MTDARNAPLAYLATPYSRYAGGITQAWVAACELSARLLVAGIKVYSPIAHSHGIAMHGGIDPYDLSIWLPFDEAIMSVSSVLIVAHMDGWFESQGVAHEIAFFEQAGKPIFDLDPESLVMVRRMSESE